MFKRRGIVLLTRDLSRQWIDWMKQAKLNVLGLHPFYKDHHIQLEHTLNEIKKPEFQQLIKIAIDADITIELECHALSWLLPRKNFSVHTEWFRMDRTGKRNPDFNICVSNSDALNILSQNSTLLAVEVSKLLKNSSHRYYFWQDDARDAYCHCDQCEKYTPSDQALLMMNVILNGVKKHDPDGKLAYLAYTNTATPPSKVNPLPGIFLEFAPITRNHRVSISNPWSIRNRKKSSQLNQLLKYWGAENAQILGYWLDDSLFSIYQENLRVKLPFNQKRMQNDAIYYKKLGIDSVTCFGAFLDEKYIKRHGKPPIDEYGGILSMYFD